jgi:hypothetical protein
MHGRKQAQQHHHGTEAESSHRARRLEHGCAKCCTYHENEEAPLALDKIGIQK